MSGIVAWCDGRFLAADREPAVLATDRAFTQGLGVFETCGVVGVTVPLWKWHERRMTRGAARLGLPGAPPKDLEAVVLEVAHRSGHGDPIVRVTWTAGADDGARPSFVVTARPRLRQPTVRLALAPLRRHGSDPLADVKHVSRAFYAVAFDHARRAGADDAVILDEAGHVLETATANLIWQHDGAWCTPAANGRLLPGIARLLLLDALAARGEPAREVECDVADLANVDEFCVVNAVHGPRAATLGERPVVPFDSDHPLVRAWRGILERG